MRAARPCARVSAPHITLLRYSCSMAELPAIALYAVPGPSIAVQTSRPWLYASAACLTAAPCPVAVSGRLQRLHRQGAHCAGAASEGLHQGGALWAGQHPGRAPRPHVPDPRRRGVVRPSRDPVVGAASQPHLGAGWEPDAVPPLVLFHFAAGQFCFKVRAVRHTLPYEL